MNATWQDVEARFAELRKQVNAGASHAVIGVALVNAEETLHAFIKVVAPGAFLPPVKAHLILNAKTGDIVLSKVN